MPDGLQPFLFAYVTAIRPFLFLATARIRAVLRAVLRILGGKRIRRSRRNHLSDKNFTKVSVSEIDDLILMTYLPYILSRES